MVTLQPSATHLRKINAPAEGQKKGKTVFFFKKKGKAMQRFSCFFVYKNVMRKL
jgi:hypothetical protein